MTTQEMIIAVYEHLGNPTNWEIYTDRANFSGFDITLDGSQKILEWLNLAYKIICNWKFPDGKQVRFNALYDELFFKTTTLTGTATTGTASTITLDSSADNTIDYYNGWIIKLTGGTGINQIRMIVDYSTARVATVNRDWDTTPDSTSTYTVFKRFMKFVPSTASDATDNIVLNPINQLLSVLKVTDLEDKRDLERGERTEAFTHALETDSVPTAYIIYNNKLLFSSAYSTARWYRLEYVKHPAELSAATDEPVIPDSYHLLIVLEAARMGHQRFRDYTIAGILEKDVEKKMKSLKQEIDLSDERVNGFFSVKGF